MPAHSELAAAVVGCGGAGTNHARAFRSSDDTYLVGVCDLDTDRAAELAADYDVPAFEDQDTLHTETDPDLVSVATPEAHHVDPTITALEAGAHVVCEKMMATSIGDGERMVEAADQYDRTLAVDFNYRHMPAFARLADAVADDELGAVSLAVAETHAFAWHHALDLLVSILGRPRTVVSARLDHDESLLPEQFRDLSDELLYIPSRAVTATFAFESGATATLSASLGTDLERHLIDLSVYGEEGRASLRGVTPTDSTGRVEPGPLADSLREQPRIALEDSFERSIHAVAEAISRDKRPPTTGRDALRVMRMERAVVEAAEREASVVVE